MNTQAKVAIDKREHPERYCPAPRCLWKTAKLNPGEQTYSGGGYCPRHKPAEQFTGSLTEELTNQDFLDAEEKQ